MQFLYVDYLLIESLLISTWSNVLSLFFYRSYSMDRLLPSRMLHFKALEFFLNTHWRLDRMKVILLYLELLLVIQDQLQFMVYEVKKVSIAWFSSPVEESPKSKNCRWLLFRIWIFIVLPLMAPSMTVRILWRQISIHLNLGTTSNLVLSIPSTGAMF